jgi:hypothetical protein
VGQLSLRASLAALLTFGISADLTAQSDASEYRIKAAFLFNFAKFVDWPSDTFVDQNHPISFCTVGYDPFNGALDDVVNGNVIAGRVIRVQHFKNLQDISGCQILFIGYAQKKLLPAVIDRFKNSPVLTVGESQRFAQQGGMIGLLLEEDKLRFEINLASARQARLNMSAKLLALAKTVIASKG